MTTAQRPPVPEISFDVSEWGSRTVPRLYRDDAEREQQKHRPKPSWWPELLATAERLEAERLDRPPEPDQPRGRPIDLDWSDEAADWIKRRR
jgi:hypothetical protein